MATCTVTGTLLDPSGLPVSGATVYARVPVPYVTSTSVITPVMVSAVSTTLGAFTIALQQSMSVIFTVQYPIVGTEPMRMVSYTGNIPATTSADFINVIVQEA